MRVGAQTCPCLARYRVRMLHLRRKDSYQGVLMKKFFIAIMSLFTMVLRSPPHAAPETGKSLYERLGGVPAIAAAVDHL